MLKLKTITMRNFLSIGNVTQAIRLDDHGLSLVLGSNSDSNNGQTRNGAGKTAISQAISYVLYGQPITKIKIDNLINNINQRGMLVTIDFDYDDVSYRIERGRKPNILKFFVNDEEVSDLSRGENKDTQVDIDQIIGMSHQMFTHIIMMNTHTTPFLRLSAKDQREVSEELLGVMQISMRAESLKKLMGTTKDSIRQEEANIKATQEANARIENAIDKAQQQFLQWETAHQKSVTELARQIDDLRGIDFDHEKSLFDAVDAWNAHQTSLQSVLSLETQSLDQFVLDLKRHTTSLDQLLRSSGANNDFSVNRLEKERDRKIAQRDELVELTDKLEKKIEEKKKEIEDPSEHHCITCEQPLNGTDHMKKVIASLQAQYDDLVKKVSSNDRLLAELRSEIVEVIGDIEDAKQQALLTAAENEKKIEDIKNIISALETSKKECLERIDDIKDKMMSDDEKPRTLFLSRDELYATKHLLDNCEQQLDRERKQDNPYDQHLKSLRGTLHNVDYEEINRLNELFRHQDFLMKLLTNKDSFVRKKIIDQNLHYLNTRLNFYLQKLGFPHEVVFRNDLTVDISLLGRDFDFEQLSRGEMNRVMLGVSWAFRDVWESLNNTINLVWADEVLDSGLDGNGSECALGVFKSFARNRKNVFIISHRDELIGRIDRTLLVSKENGFTNITEDIN